MSDASGPDQPRAAVGQVVTAQLSGQVEGRHSVLVVPGRRYDFTVSTPRERIDQVSADDAEVSAEGGDDIRFVSLAWDLEAQPGDVFVMDPPQDAHPLLTVVADGADLPVGPLDEEGVHAVHVAVPADAEDIGYRVEYDGLVQTVDDAYDPVLARGDGPGSLYHDVPRFEWGHCPSSRLWPERRSLYAFGADCAVRVSNALPYAGEVGWASPGRAWVVVDFSARPVLVGYDGTAGVVDYVVEPAPVRLSLEGGTGPRLFPLEEGEEVGLQSDGSWSARAVFEVADTSSRASLSFRRVVRARAEDPDEARSVGAPTVVRRVYAGKV